jgi:2-dehydropantoate 2-reductase
MEQTFAPGEALRSNEEGKNTVWQKGDWSMKIAIVGLGGVGGYYGGLLARHYVHEKGTNIIFIARGAHLDEIKKTGLRVITERDDFMAKPYAATDDPAVIGIMDCVLFCVKGYDLERSAKALSSNVDENTIVISLLNGVDNADRLESILPGKTILNGCVYISSHIDQPGVIKQVGGSCKLFFGSESNAQFDGSGIETLFRSAGIDAEYRNDIQQVVWEKYIFISPFASATTLMDNSIGELLKHDRGKALLGNLFDEVLSVAHAKGIDFSADMKETTIQKALNFPAETKTSLQLDFERGKRAELDTFTGFIVNEGNRLGVPVPNHQSVYAELKTRMNT